MELTYNLEGDGILALECYEIINSVRNSILVHHWPNTAAVAKRIATTAIPEAEWMEYATACVQKGLDYFEKKFFQDFLPVMNAFKSAQLFHPGKINDLKPMATSVDSLNSFPFFDNDLLAKLKSELPNYLASADGVSREVDPLEWWGRNKATLPFWSLGFYKVALCQPSSASVERVFSVLKRHFSDSQQSSL